MAVLPRAVRDGDAVTIENVRNFEYRSLDDFTPRYETRTYHLANLKGVDIIFFNWGSPWMSHPVLVFDFGPDGRICMSIEVRYRKGQDYSVLRSLYRQQELIFLVADERDVILRRTKYGRTPGGAPVPLQRERPRNCGPRSSITSRRSTACTRRRAGTTACARTAPRRSTGCPSSRCRCDWRVLANGRLDRALYEDGRLDRTLPFPELRRLAYLNDDREQRPRGRVRGSHPPRTRKAPP